LDDGASLAAAAPAGLAAVTQQAWKRLQELFGEALELDPAARRLLVERLAGEDPQLSAELQSLLAELESGDDSLQSAAVGDLVAEVSCWKPERIGGYRIIRELGRGGSGIVFQARGEGETPGQPVALKVLRLSGWDEARGYRASSERRILARLHHPNITSLLDWGSTADGLPYLVMEFIDGQPLDSFCRENTLDLQDRLALFMQILRAVAHAHQSAVIHRDLKPGNILVTVDRRVKLLDFGISKLFEANSTITATMERRFTPAYASPEQIKGDRTGPLTDVYALGVILYELVTGQLPYHIRTRAVEEISRAVLEQRPVPPSRAPDVEPARAGQLSGDLDRMILKALNKHPAGRYASVEDFAEDLNRYAVAGSKRRRTCFLRYKKAAWASLAAGIAGLAAAGWVSSHRSQPGRAHLVASRMITAQPDVSVYPALSANGDKLVYASDRGGKGRFHLWVQNTITASATQLTSGYADDTDPAFSPDGKLIAFRSEREPKGIYLIDANGGSEKYVGPAGRSPRFSPDGQLLTYWTADPVTNFGSVWNLPVQRGLEPSRLARDFDDAHNPVWTPDSRAILICGTHRSRGGPSEEHDLWIVPNDGGPPVKTGAHSALAKYQINPHASRLRATSFQWLPGAVLLDGERAGVFSMWVLPISFRTWKVTADPYSFSGAAVSEIHPALAGSHAALARVRSAPSIWSLPLKAELARVSGPLQRVTSSASDHFMPSLSRDGRALVFLSAKSGYLTPSSGDFQTASEQPLGPSFSSNRLKISGDGRSAFFRVLEGEGIQRQAIYRKDFASGHTDLVCADCGGPTYVSNDGSLVLYETGNSIVSIEVLDTQSGQKRALVRHSHHPVQAARLSPDGRWVVFECDRGVDGRQLLTAPFHDDRPVLETEWIAFTPEHGVAEEPSWSPGGEWIYYLDHRDGARCLWARKWNTSDGKPVGDPIAIQHFHSSRLTPLALDDRGSRYIGLSVARDRLVLTLSEVSAGVWLGDVRRAASP
jgi:Tol biopolymer transport system component/predicted Ser/Thr protein kinase